MIAHPIVNECHVNDTPSFRFAKACSRDPEPLTKRGNHIEDVHLRITYMRDPALCETKRPVGSHFPVDPDPAEDDIRSICRADPHGSGGCLT